MVAQHETTTDAHETSLYLVDQQQPDVTGPSAAAQRLVLRRLRQRKVNTPPTSPYRASLGASIQRRAL